VALRVALEVAISCLELTLEVAISCLELTLEVAISCLELTLEVVRQLKLREDDEHTSSINGTGSGLRFVPHPSSDVSALTAP
jgi:hypothetical protein